MKVVANKVCFAFGSLRQPGDIFDTNEEIWQYPFLEKYETEEAAIVEERGEVIPPPVIPPFKALPMASKEVFTCPDCDFTTFKKVALFGHRRSHK
jgi:hypothetical protein